MGFLSAAFLRRWWPALVGAGIILAVLAWGQVQKRQGYREAIEDRKEAAQEAKERADEIESEVGDADDDSLLDGILRPDD